MILLGIFMLYGFIRTLYCVFRELKNDNYCWRISWTLLSIVNLIGALYFLGYEEYLLKLKYQYLYVYYIFIGAIIVTFFYGGYKKNLTINDLNKRRKMNIELYSAFIALIIAIILDMN